VCTKNENVGLGGTYRWLRTKSYLTALLEKSYGSLDKCVHTTPAPAKITVRGDFSCKNFEDTEVMSSEPVMEGGGGEGRGEGRGGFGRGGRGGRSGRGRGRGGRGRGGGREEQVWVPVTKLGRLVKEGKIGSIEEIFLFSLPVKEAEIIDFFLKDKLQDEVMKIMPVQKQSSAGQRTRFKAFVAIGDTDGHVGLGVKCSSEVANAIRGAITAAKLNVCPVRRGYWGRKSGKSTQTDFTRTFPLKNSHAHLIMIAVVRFTAHGAL
jgi:hypothetical protein